MRVELQPGAGIVPGARLRAFIGSDVHQVAVRTSLDREVGFTRHPDGGWMTITKVDEIIVAVPAADDPNSAEVFSFDRKVLINACDAALTAQRKKHPKFSPKAPIFIGLDPPRPKPRSQHPPSDVFSDLRAKAKWITVVPLTAAPMLEKPEPFIERVKKEFAALNGVDVSRVAVEFKIIA
jgi:hypothetical protein